jgi:hypothetical protein
MLGKWNWWAPDPLRRMYERSSSADLDDVLKTTVYVTTQRQEVC